MNSKIVQPLRCFVYQKYNPQGSFSINQTMKDFSILDQPRVTASHRKSSFARLFFMSFKCPPREWILEHRCKHAAWRLSHARITDKQILNDYFSIFPSSTKISSNQSASKLSAKMWHSWVKFTKYPLKKLSCFKDKQTKNTLFDVPQPHRAGRVSFYEEKFIPPRRRTSRTTSWNVELSKFPRKTNPNTELILVKKFAEERVTGSYWWGGVFLGINSQKLRLAGLGDHKVWMLAFYRILVPITRKWANRTRWIFDCHQFLLGTS